MSECTCVVSSHLQGCMVGSFCTHKNSRSSYLPDAASSHFLNILIVFCFRMASIQQVGGGTTSDFSLYTDCH